MNLYTKNNMNIICIVFIYFTSGINCQSLEKEYTSTNTLQDAYNLQKGNYIVFVEILPNEEGFIMEENGKFSILMIDSGYSN
jgi:hypothetical protein